ncbi:MAG: ATP-dependent DNA helicase RecG [Phycisphaeraceae bacterium]|nr:ATP-dependent DNA helicase RecG [Phycisphaeraceae bacterium]
MPIDLLTPLSEIPGVGANAARALRALGVTRVGHLIAHIPNRHERIEALATLGSLEADQLVSARGEVTATRLAGRRPKQRFEAVLCDDSGRLDLVWFNSPFLRDKIHPGAHLRVQGKTRQYGQHGLQIANPVWEILGQAGPPADDDRIRPVYPASEHITSRQIEAIVQRVLPEALPLLEDHLPEAYRREREFPSLAEAYRMIHAPQSEAQIDHARRRLAYDELLFLQLGVHLKRAHLRTALKAPALRAGEAIDRHIRERLPHTLTQAQERVVSEISRELAASVPANRLIQGDVGSGKTLVAVYAMLMAVAGEHQAALMAPTEILAEQHFATISEMLTGSRVRVELLTGTTPEAERASIHERLASGDVDVVIGTHALITESVRFHSLAVAVIDEQHRFGVHQRARLRAKGDDQTSTPHVLVMTATPIPRTLALTVFGDLDVSVIDALPPGRQPITTRVVGPEQRAEVYAWLRSRLDSGEQAYIVAPVIEPGERGVIDVRTLARDLERDALSGRRLALLHGKLKRATRESLMARFRARQIDALVATTVIEVGVDVPNASIMIVENAERFGLAQLHQLRGRVGRGDRPSACVLIGQGETEDARLRLEAIAATTDGFALAEKDLEIRGPGQVIGARQSGMPDFKVADLTRDRELLAMARRDARDWIERSATLDAPDEALLRRRLMKQFGETLGLADVG